MNRSTSFSSLSSRSSTFDEIRLEALGAGRGEGAGSAADGVRTEVRRRIGSASSFGAKVLSEWETAIREISSPSPME